MKMKANELMIGDWVNINLSPDVHDKMFHTRITIGNLIALERGYTIKVKPIPITEEILKANGWKWRKKGLIYSMRLFDEEGHSIMTLTYGNLMSIGGHEIKVQYVHELQRALRCCGLFDLANNFKI